MMRFNSSTINLCACPEGIAFPTKYIPLSKTSTRIVLGRTSATQQHCHPTNGLFSYNRDSDELPVSPAHAEMWLESGAIYLKDLNSPTGTFVNHLRIDKPIPVSNGDIVTLGVANKELPVVFKVVIS